MRVERRNTTKSNPRADNPPTGTGITPKGRPWNWKVIGLVILSVVLAYCSYRLVQHFWGDNDFRRAQAASEQRDFAKTSQLLAQYLKENPDDLPALLLAAQTARRQGKFALFSELLNDYESKKGGKDRSAVERKLARLQQGDLADADALWRECQTRPDAPDSLLILEALIEGSLKVLVAELFGEVKQQGEIDAAGFRRAEQAIGLWLERFRKPVEQTQGFVWRGKLFSIARDYPKAQADFRRALELDSNHLEARQSLASLLILDAPEEAAAHLEALRLREPANRQIKFMLATVRRNLGRPQEAGPLLDELLMSEPNNIQYLLERARVGLDNRRPDQAIGLLDRLVSIAPNHPDAFLVYSQCYQLLDKPEEARRYHDRYLELIAAARPKSGK